jgi:hypothetical protein
VSEEPIEPIAPLPVLVPYSRFQEAQQPRHPAVPADLPLTDQPPTAVVESVNAPDAEVRSILGET